MFINEHPSCRLTLGQSHNLVVDLCHQLKGKNHMKKQIVLTLACVLLTVLFSGCTPTSTPVPSTSTPIPTYTTVPTTIPTLPPTRTPKPTRTPVPPTATIPAPDKVLEYLNDVQITYNDSFDNPLGKGWWLGNGRIKNGVLEFDGKNWNGLVREQEFQANQGIVLDFTYTRGSVFELYMSSGDWQTDPYKRFGVYLSGGSAQANLWQGKNGLGFNNLLGNLILQPDKTYSILMAILPDGEFLGVIWDPSEQSKSIYYREKISEKWANIRWTFSMGADRGTILFDNFREISFSGAK